MTQDDIDSLWSSYRKAWKELQGAQGKSAQGKEVAYGLAYQALVRAGQVPQLRGKYRYSL
jgi:hypothetical protein